MHDEEILLTQERLERVRKTSVNLAETALALKVIADQVRADLDDLAVRMTAVEDNNSQVAKSLEDRTEVINGEQVKQDLRLDTLEEN